MKTFLSTAFLALALMFSVPESSLASVPDGKVLMEREKDYFNAIINKDYEAVDRILAANYFATYALGIVDKEREMKDVREFPLASYEITDAKTEFLSPTIGILAFRLHVKVIVDGKEFFEDDFLTCVWVKEKKHWLMRSQTAVKAQKQQNS